MIDLHSHVLPGLDDGARTLDESVALARAAVADGVRVLAATPHVRHDYPTSADEMERLLALVRDAVAAAGLELELVGGGELALEVAATTGPDALARFALGAGTTLLLEFPYAGWPVELEMQVFTLRTHGFRVLLAHPERSAEVISRPDRLRAAVEAGALVQITAASLDGRLGRPVRETARRLLELGLAHVVASDAHAAEDARGGLGTVRDAVRDDGLARWLTEGAPAAILAGEPVPPAPRRRSLLGRRLGSTR